MPRLTSSLISNNFYSFSELQPQGPFPSSLPLLLPSSPPLPPPPQDTKAICCPGLPLLTHWPSFFGMVTCLYDLAIPFGHGALGSRIPSQGASSQYPQSSCCLTTSLAIPMVEVPASPIQTQDTREAPSIMVEVKGHKDLN